MAMQACGYDGDACDVCGVGEGCANGCSFTACFQTCDGCCDGAGVCHPGLDNTACGRGRGFCRACSAPFSCVRTDPDEIQTFCDIPPGDRFTVDMLAVDVPATKPDGSAWDAFGGLPDLVVDVYAYNPTGASSVTLPEQSGTLHATWSGTAGATVTTVREHLSSIQFRVIDADINNDDLVERCTFSSYIFTQPKLVASLFSGATQECRENGTTFRFKLRRAP